MRRDVPIIRYPHGTSQIPVSITTAQKQRIIFFGVFLYFEKYQFWGRRFFRGPGRENHIRKIPTIIHERYMSDHIEKVMGAGYICLGHIIYEIGWSRYTHCGSKDDGNDRDDQKEIFHSEKWLFFRKSWNKDIGFFLISFPFTLSCIFCFLKWYTRNI